MYTNPLYRHRTSLLKNGNYKNNVQSIQQPRITNPLWSFPIPPTTIFVHLSRTCKYHFRKSCPFFFFFFSVHEILQTKWSDKWEKLPWSSKWNITFENNLTKCLKSERTKKYNIKQKICQHEFFEKFYFKTIVLARTVILHSNVKFLQ